MFDSAQVPGPMKAGRGYQRTYTKNRFSQDALAEYAGYRKDSIPIFRTVGIDHSFYRPASAVQLAHYASQVPDDFRFCSKVWEDITIPVYANLPRYGARAGKANPRFLDVVAFSDLVWAPAQEGLGASRRIVVGDGKTIDPRPW